MTSDNNIIVSVASMRDLPVIQRLGIETYRQHFSAIWSKQGLEDFVERDFSDLALAESLTVPEQTCWMLVNEPGGEEIGFVKINWQQPDSLEGSIGAELQKIYFLKRATGKGYGLQAMQVVFDHARQRGETSIWLDVLNSNTGASRFYLRLGFKALGEVPFKTDISDVGMTVMRYDLSSDN